MILEWNALNLVVNHARVVVAGCAIGGVECVAEVENKKTAVVSGGKEARDNMYIIAISAMLSKAG
jgi:hypothetical protein